MSSFERAGLVSEAVPTKDAATVMLLRDGAPGAEVFLLRRVKGMSFAGGATVFPGGGVDPADNDAAIDWAGPSDAWWGEQFDISVVRARALVLAAVRETFEECGVLLAGPTADTVVADTSRYSEERRAIESRTTSFGDFLQTEGLVVRADLLRPWSHWVTPVGEPRRYDTFFFVAVAPDGQSADGETTEADGATWRRPAEALQHWSSGASVLLPPTWSQLESLSAYPELSQVLAADVSLAAVEPVIRLDSDRMHVEFPGDSGYYGGGGPIPF